MNGEEFFKSVFLRPPPEPASSYERYFATRGVLTDLASKIPVEELMQKTGYKRKAKFERHLQTWVTLTRGIFPLKLLEALDLSRDDLRAAVEIDRQAYRFACGQPHRVRSVQCKLLPGVVQTFSVLEEFHTDVPDRILVQLKEASREKPGRFRILFDPETRRIDVEKGEVKIVQLEPQVFFNAGSVSFG